MYRSIGTTGMSLQFTASPGTLKSSSSNDFGNLTAALNPASLITGSASNSSGPSVADAIAAQAAARQAAINAGTIYAPDATSVPVINPIASQGPRPVSYDLDGKRYTAPFDNYIGHDPSSLFCQGGNKPPCACATQELKDYILNNRLCTVTSGVSVRGIGSVYTPYVTSVYNAAGRPDNTFKWYDKWFSSTDGFNPCDVLRLPTCAVDCNAPWYEPVRIDPNYGYCRSTRVVQKPGTPYSPVVKSTYSPVVGAGFQSCAAGTHFASGGCVPDKPISQLVAENPPTPATPTSSSSMMTGAWWLLLIVAAGGVYYLSTKKKGK